MQMPLFAPANSGPVPPAAGEVAGPESHADPVAELEGLLAGPAQVVRGPRGARLSVVLPSAPGEQPWRERALLAGFTERGLTGELTTTVAGLTAVRTGFSPSLDALARRWTHGAVKQPPPGFALDGARLRWWALAAGRAEHRAFQFGLSESDKSAWSTVERALRAAGLTVTLVGPRAGGPAFRVTGQRRLVALRALLGPSPDASAEWP